MTTYSKLVRLGAMAWILGTVQFFVFHIVVELAWTKPYSWAHNNISDLGNVNCGAWGDDGRYVCSPLHGWMNASFVIQGVLLIIGLLLTRSRWRSFLTKSSLIFILLAGLGWVLVGMAPADLDESLHILGALLVFFCGNLGLIFADSLLRKNMLPTVRTYSRPLGAIGLVATALFLGQIHFVFGQGGMERFAVFPLQIWSAWIGVYLWRTFEKENAVHPSDDLR
ncbi:DUF998 domain-containing protein [Phormidesmis sp. 146-12]